MPGFDDQSVRRISRTVQTSEKRLRGRRQKRGRWNGKGGSGRHRVKLQAALDFNDATGVTGTVWVGKPATATTREISGIVADETITTSGTFPQDAFVWVDRIDGLWFVTGYACS